jgi:hypothetical protein
MVQLRGRLRMIDLIFEVLKPVADALAARIPLSEALFAR